MDRLSKAKRVFNLEIQALAKMRDSLDDTYLQILDLITHCTGKVVVTGIGKSGHVAAKVAATLSSLGTPSVRLHPAEAMHGDLGMISGNDIVIAISFSGESDEIIRILPNIKMIGAPIIGITGNPNSTLAKVSDIVQVLPEFQEADNLGLAPTSSTTVELCYGDSLAVVASEIYGFTNNDFAKFHPAGALGKKLILKVGDLMVRGNKNAVLNVNDSIKNAIVELCQKGLGAVSIVDDENKLLGIITDGNLRRQLEKETNIYNQTIKEIMTLSPVVISEEKLAIEAMHIMKEKKISCLIVTNGDQPVGTIRLQDIVGAGIAG